MGEATELAVLGKFPSAAVAKRVRAMLAPGKRPAFAEDWPKAAQPIYAALEELDAPED